MNPKARLIVASAALPLAVMSFVIDSIYGRPGWAAFNAALILYWVWNIRLGWKELK